MRAVQSIGSKKLFLKVDENTFDAATLASGVGSAGGTVVQEDEDADFS